MVDITTRAGKGSPLSHAEVDTNFNNLKTAVESNVTALADAGGVTVYSTIDDLPLSSLTAGDLAYVSATNRLYLTNGTGWYNIALVNQTPTISGNSASYTLAIDGTPTVVTLAATDPEGLPITWSYVTTGLTNEATITNTDNVFTITPSTDPANQGDFSITFRASDGVNIGTAASDFTLAFTDPNWANVAFSMSTESGSVTDKVDAATVFTLYNNGTDTTYTKLEPQSLELPATQNGVLISNPTTEPMNFGTDYFTVEFFYYHYFTPAAYSGFWTAGTNNDGFSFGWGASSGQVRLKMLDNTVGSFVASVGLAYNNWHHFAVTRGPAPAGQNNHRMTIWLNGSKVDHANIGTTEVVNSTVNNAGAFWIGKTLAEQAAYLGKGWIDSFQISKYAKYVDDGTSTTYTVPSIRFGPDNA